MRVYAAILAAGRGIRFGSDKTEALLGDKPIWRWAVDTFISHPRIDGVALVVSPDKMDLMRDRVEQAVILIEGGGTRQQSSYNATIELRDADILLLHDAARPFVSHDLITRTIEAIERSSAAAAAIKVVDTIKEVGADSLKTLDRSRLVAMQTPQGARRELLLRAHQVANADFTDEMALIEALGMRPELVEGTDENFKITSPTDLARARSMIQGPETRTGIGYDIHPISSDPSRSLYLGGVLFPDHPALDGHSDADVLLHAACDALLGAASLGDIGQHFPNTDPTWKGCPSIRFVERTAVLLAEAGWRIINLDMTLIAESPKVMKRAAEIREVVADALKISSGRISLKATTNERLGTIGRGEGMAAMSVATIAQLSA